jgi:hypothetical protein
MGGCLAKLVHAKVGDASSYSISVGCWIDEVSSICVMRIYLSLDLTGERYSRIGAGGNC